MMAAFSKMPALADMVRVKSPMERKFVCANLQKLSSTLVDIVMAFTDTDVVESIGDIVGAPRLEADLNLYNGGITVMLPGDFMCPHLDNSHDRARRRRREIVLLYYITPCWLPDYEGNLELWDLTRKERQTVVQFCSNRLVLLETTNASWHAIPPIAGPLPRLSVTSYLYAPETEVLTGPFNPLCVMAGTAIPEPVVQHAVLLADCGFESDRPIGRQPSCL